MVFLFLFCDKKTLYLVLFNVTTAKISIIVFVIFCKIFSNKRISNFIFLCLKLSELRKSSVVKKCNWWNGLLSGISAPEEVQNDFLWAEAFGRKQAKEFIDDLIKQNKTGFYDTVKKNKLKTFSSLKPGVKGKEVIIQSDRSLFARLLREKRKERKSESKEESE